MVRKIVNLFEGALLVMLVIWTIHAFLLDFGLDGKMKYQENDNVIYYENLSNSVYGGVGQTTKISVVNGDTFTVAKDYPFPACLNFASHKRPGGGYKGVLTHKGPIRTQEEDLFRRSNLPELMDNNYIRPKYYPLKDLAGFYTICTVDKDNKLDDIPSFEAGVITVPAVVDPETNGKIDLVAKKARLILEIAADQGHSTLILGAWGCGVFQNDPEYIAKTFKMLLEDYFKNYFTEVIFAIPTGPKGTVAGASANNFDIFERILNETVS